MREKHSVHFRPFTNDGCFGMENVHSSWLIALKRDTYTRILLSLHGYKLNAQKVVVYACGRAYNGTSSNECHMQG
jgi:hypothetical protein